MSRRLIFTAFAMFCFCLTVLFNNCKGVSQKQSGLVTAFSSTGPGSVGGQLGKGPGNPNPGTETGNPNGNDYPFRDYLIRSSMAKLTQCFPEDSAFFTQSTGGEVDSSPMLLVRFGLPDGLYRTFIDGYSEISFQVTEDSGIRFDYPSWITCQNLIGGLGCDSPEVVSAYDPDSPDPLENIHNLIQLDPSCRSVLRIQ